ncbi:hypothetical protein [Demequina flava]|uniref:hypothetical protein n=1 Tax=Demequina flava TaxID=1095025 RepID=UPI000780D263|nr:hypothetical protein [Demequina flava]
MTESRQITDDELRGLTPAQINEHRLAGRLDALMRGETPKTTPEEAAPRFSGSADAGPRGDTSTYIHEADLATMSATDINNARRLGQLDHITRKH